jgi:hypothetical protein
MRALKVITILLLMVCVSISLYAGNKDETEVKLDALSARITQLEQAKATQTPDVTGSWILWSFPENEMAEVHRNIFARICPDNATFCTNPTFVNAGRVGFDPPQPMNYYPTARACFEVTSQNGHEFSGTRRWTQGASNCPPDNPSCLPNGKPLPNSVPREGTFKGYVVGNMITFTSDEIIPSGDPDPAEWIRSFQGVVDFTGNPPHLTGVTHYLKIMTPVVGSTNLYYGGYRLGIGYWAPDCATQ